jgi:hypothetical protein
VRKAMHTAMYLSRFNVRPAFSYGAELPGLAYVRPPGGWPPLGR